MPPRLTFEPWPPPQRPAKPAPAEIDAAGDRRPRCTVTVPQAQEPGGWFGECNCGASFIVGVRGDGADTQKVLVACWQRQVAPPSRPARQDNLL